MGGYCIGKLHFKQIYSGTEITTVHAVLHNSMQAWNYNYCGLMADEVHLFYAYCMCVYCIKCGLLSLSIVIKTTNRNCLPPSINIML